MKLGNTGGKNKGKKYLKITGFEEITPANQAKANLFKEWFGNNYKRLQIELVAKRTYNEDILNDTFLRIHEKILYGGIDIADYKAYFHRAFYTNYVQDSMKEAKISQMVVSDEYAVDTLDETLEEIAEQQQKLQLYKDVLQFVRKRFDESEYALFNAYIKLGNRKYEAVSQATNTPNEYTINTISKIKRSIRQNKTFVHLRQAM